MRVRGLALLLAAGVSGLLRLREDPVAVLSGDVLHDQPKFSYEEIADWLSVHEQYKTPLGAFFKRGRELVFRNTKNQESVVPGPALDEELGSTSGGSGPAAGSGSSLDKLVRTCRNPSGYSPPELL